MNARKFFLISSLAIFFAVLIFFAFVNLFPNIGKINYQNNSGNNNQNLQYKTGIEVIYPKTNQEISSPLKIEGYVNGDGWIGFEAQVGTVKLFDSKGKELGLALLTAKGEWMQVKIDFVSTMSFVSTEAQQGSLVFYNENPSGEPSRDKTFTLPVRLPKMDTMEISVFFSKFGENDCEKVYPVNRLIEKTIAPARTALEELLVGPKQGSESNQYFTGINPGVKIQSLTIENGVAKVDFSEELDENVAGSCRVLSIRAQIEKTLLQFPTVKSVIISVNGRTDDILQP